ncbi:MAG: lipopolysaccharide biosynthesis protein [Paludibacteraceae bacterium]|nr:lipopolysaccharide biosynthesis protein [Paludibacteraceae bacterium]
MSVEVQADKRRIAKNTLMLYSRMFLIMGVSLFTQRIVLYKLGASDYGIYNAVAGVVAMLGFLNGTLSTGTSRFLTFEIGKGDTDRLRQTFSTSFYSHLILAIIVSFILLTGGIWFVEHRLIIPPERLNAALWVLIVSIFTTFVSITQVPYTSVIIAREDMGIYAYVGLFEALAKLAIAYLISITHFDKLIFYAVLLAAVQVLTALVYRYFCIRRYSESHLTKTFNKPIFNEILGFSSWSLIANISQILSTQGLTVLMNIFVSPVIISAQAIGNQISSAITLFRTNFTTAINPQIIKLYSIGEYQKSKNLVLESSIYIFDLLLLICLPIIVFMEPVLNLWLIDVPEYAVIFSQYILISRLIGIYDNTLYIPLIASGRLKENSYMSVFVSIFGMIGLYFMLKAGWDLMWVQYVTIIQSAVYSFIIKPAILCKYVPDYKLADIMTSSFQMIKVSIIPILISILIFKHVSTMNIVEMIFFAVLIMLSVCISSFLCMDKKMRYKLIGIVQQKIFNIDKNVH